MDFLPESLLREVLAPLYPGRALGAIAASRIRSFQHQLFHLRVGFEGGGPGKQPEELFFRLYSGNFSWWELSSDLRAKEAAAFAYVRHLGFAVPEFLLQNENPPISITRRVPGRSVAEDFCPENIAVLASTLTSLHDQSAALLSEISVFPDLSLPALLGRLTAWSAECGDAALNEMVEWVSRGLADVDEDRVFLHGDCNAKNFLVSAGGIVMLDLEECGVGDRRLDLATMMTNLPRGEARESFLRAYGRGITLADLEPWMNLIDVRDIVTARVVERRAGAGREIPRFNSGLWAQYAGELWPRVRGRMERAATRLQR